MINYILGIITGILLSLVSIIANKLDINKVKSKVLRQKAEIVHLTNPLDNIDL